MINGFIRFIVCTCPTRIPFGAFYILGVVSLKQNLTKEEKLSYLIRMYGADEILKGLHDFNDDVDEYYNEILKAVQEEYADNKNKQMITISLLTQEIEQMGYSVRFNDILQKIEVSGQSQLESTEHISDNIPSILADDLKYKYKGCTTVYIQETLKVIATRNRYNPVLDKLKTAEYDGNDYLSELYEILSISETDTLSRTLIKKWLWQSLAMLHNTPERPFGAEGVLVFTGKQGIGKTSVFRKLAMIDSVFKEGVSLDFRDKDSYINATACWIAELGEIESTFKSDINRLKAFITSREDEYRKAYGRDTIRAVRRTSLCGSCNSNEFLIDETGNRRFFSVPLEKINLDRLREFNVLQLWKQVEQWVDEDLQGFRLTPEENKLLAERNKHHEKPMKAESEILDILVIAEQDTHYYAEEMTVSDFKNNHDVLKPYTVVQIGKVLEKLGHNSILARNGKKVARVRILPKWYYENRPNKYGRWCDYVNPKPKQEVEIDLDNLPEIDIDF